MHEYDSERMLMSIAFIFDGGIADATDPLCLERLEDVDQLRLKSVDSPVPMFAHFLTANNPNDSLPHVNTALERENN